MATTTSDTRSSEIRAVHREPSTLRALDWVALVLAIIGGINWGLVGLFDVDLVAGLFGDASAISRVVYVLVGLAALYLIAYAARLARRTGSPAMT